MDRDLQLRPTPDHDCPLVCGPRSTSCDTMRCLTGSRTLCHRRCVADASHLQVRSRGRRCGLAAITAAWLVVSGVLAMHHEAAVGHVRDRAGAYLHATTVAGHHAGSGADIHGDRKRTADVGDCALLTALHQAASAQVAAPALIIAARATHVPRAPEAATREAATAVYRLAPKTSPPVAV
jgi:hypothetical protein